LKTTDVSGKERSLNREEFDFILKRMAKMLYPHGKYFKFIQFLQKKKKKKKNKIKFLLYFYFYCTKEKGREHIERLFQEVLAEKTVSSPDGIQ
jgi:hypothetical protein